MPRKKLSPTDKEVAAESKRLAEKAIAKQMNTEKTIAKNAKAAQMRAAAAAVEQVETPEMVKTVVAPKKPRTTKLPEKYPDLPDKYRQMLDLYPKGNSVIISRGEILALQAFYLDIADIAIPNSIATHFEKQNNLVRKLLNLIPLAEADEVMKENFPTFTPHKTYYCKCLKRRKKS